MVTAASLDMSNHWLNRPDSFFSAPHVAVYTGVAITIMGVIWSSMRKSPRRQETMFISNKGDNGRLSKPGFFHTVNINQQTIRMLFCGAIILVLAGPFDFTWHQVFGLDGLLSPSHATFRIGQALCGIGALLGIVSTNPLIDPKPRSKIYYSLYPLFIIVAIVPLWRIANGFVGMVTLPFSNTASFQWNPDPLMAVIIAIVCFPLITSLFLFCAFRLGNFKLEGKLREESTKEKGIKYDFKFGILTTTGVCYMAINILTAFVPNPYLHSTLPFYLLNIIPLVVVDFILTKTYSKTSISNSRKKSIEFVAGALLGMTFITIVFPFITYTYNAVVQYPENIGPYNVSRIWFNIMQVILPWIIIPSIISGILGIVIASHLVSHKISQPVVNSK